MYIVRIPYIIGYVTAVSKKEGYLYIICPKKHFPSKWNHYHTVGVDVSFTVSESSYTCIRQNWQLTSSSMLCLTSMVKIYNQKKTGDKVWSHNVLDTELGRTGPDKTGTRKVSILC